MLEYSKGMVRVDIERKLKANGVPLDCWGKDGANTLDDLLKEIAEGETRLIVENGKVIRLLNVVNVNVVYEDETGTVYILKEDRQEMNDGSTRKRNLPSSLSEKMKPGEKWGGAVQRALSEELGIEGKIQIKDVQKKPFFVPSLSYPGTMTRSNNYIVEVALRRDQFRPEGYIEVQPGRKTTYFVWERVEA